MKIGQCINFDYDNQPMRAIVVSEVSDANLVNCMFLDGHRKDFYVDGMINIAVVDNYDITIGSIAHINGMIVDAIDDITDKNEVLTLYNRVMNAKMPVVGDHTDPACFLVCTKQTEVTITMGDISIQVNKTEGEAMMQMMAAMKKALAE